MFSGSRSSLPKMATLRALWTEKLIFSPKTLQCSIDLTHKHIDLLEPSQNADTDAFVENDNGTDDLDEDEIIAEEMSNEADDTASNQMESHKMKKNLLKNR